MSAERVLPRLLVVDDLFGRSLPDRRNAERENLCGRLLLRDVTGDEVGKGSPQKIREPLAEVVFCRGQVPSCSGPGDTVENDLEGTMKAIESRWNRTPPGGLPWSLVLLDLCFYAGKVTEASHGKTPGMPEGRPGDDEPEGYFGLEVLAEVQRRMPNLPVVILSSMPREQVSRRFAFLGARDFLPRAASDTPERLREMIRLHGLIPDDSGAIVGRSRPLLIALRAARQAAAGRRNVLIRGETGTGKELLAEYVNANGPGECRGKLEVVNSANLDPNLYSSLLFGHTRGAFTGAHMDTVGRIVRADGGDVFLDEIGSMPLGVQVGLLRVVEDGVVQPEGARAKPVSVDVRFIAAASEDIEAKVSTGGFRQDLLFRLREAGVVYLPPLRERLEDMSLLVEHFVRSAEQECPGALRRAISAEALDILSAHSWPGNLRELSSCVSEAVGSFPGVEHLAPAHLRLGGPTAPEVTAEAAAADGPGETAPRPVAGSIHAAAEWLAGMESVDLGSLSARELKGSLPRFATLLARLLRAALVATSTSSVDDPEGRTFITRAAELMAGKKMTTGQAAGRLIRMLKLSGDLPEWVLSDPVIKEALESALRNAPRSAGGKGPAPRKKQAKRKGKKERKPKQVAKRRKKKRKKKKRKPKQVAKRKGKKKRDGSPPAGTAPDGRRSMSPVG